MSRYAMLTAFGQDRPGIVAALAEGLYRMGCNIEDTCMARLRGEFAMMLMVRVPDDVAVNAVIDRLTPHTSPLGLTVLCREIPEQAASRTGASDIPMFMLSVYGADQPGIVAQVARVLAEYSANITDMNTRVIGAIDQPVYVMILEFHLPEGSQPEPLQQALDRLKLTLGVDLTVRPIETVRL